MNLDQCKAYLQQCVDKQQIPGASYAFITVNNILTDYVGFKQTLPSCIPLENNTLYDMASCTKVVVTTTLILKLIEEGFITLNTTLQSIFPDFPYENITIEHLLTHTSGLPGDDKNYRLCHNKQEMYSFINTLPLVYKTDTDLQYSDFGFIELGRVIEKYKGSIEEYANDVIFKPLNMNLTMYNPSSKGYKDKCAATENKPDRGIVVGEAHDGKAYIMGGVSGNAGLFSCVQDIGKFVQMLLKDNNTVLNHHSIELLKTYRTINKPSIRTLGWIANDSNASDGDYYSQHCLYHTGFTGTSIYVDFDRKCGIVLLTNAIHPNRNNPYIINIRNKFHNLILSEI